MRLLLSKGLAALSKPRCGSTSLRRMLDPLMSREAGDIAVDRPGDDPVLHPHVTAPYLRRVLAERGHDPETLDYIITVRHPVQMLWSYYKFFKPDAESRYFFMPDWAGRAEMAFEPWVLAGRLPVNPDWLALAPDWISPDDLSGLSLECRAMDREGRLRVDRVFRIEDATEIADWLAEKTGRTLKAHHVNRSEPADLPPLGHEAMARVRAMFPYESTLYAV